VRLSEHRPKPRKKLHRPNAWWRLGNVTLSERVTLKKHFETPFATHQKTIQNHGLIEVIYFQDEIWIDKSNTSANRVFFLNLLISH
jgi:hypothetical protein